MGIIEGFDLCCCDKDPIEKNQIMKILFIAILIKNFIYLFR